MKGKRLYCVQCYNLRVIIIWIDFSIVWKKIVLVVIVIQPKILVLI